MLKRRRINFLFIVFFISSYRFLYSIDNYNNSETYYRLSSFESVYTWSISSVRKPPYISEAFVDSTDTLHFAYYDNTINSYLYIYGKDGNFNKAVIDSGIGNLVSLYIVSNDIHLAYTKDNKIYYANNNSGSFKNYPLVLDSKIKKIIDLKLVVSVFNSPILFFIDNKGTLSVSRFFQYNFFSEAIYTNRLVDSVYPIAENDGYTMFFKEYNTGDIFYASRKTNTRFKFFDKTPLIQNVNTYDINYEAHNRFSILYINRDNKNSILSKKFYDGVFYNDTIIENNENILYFNSILDYSANNVIFYRNYNNILSFYTIDNILDLSRLGSVDGILRVVSARYPYYYIIYYNSLFNELRVSKINLRDIQK